MNPDKLFDYLDGKLAPADREQLEEKLAADPQLQRQLAIAREIHRGMRDSSSAREVTMLLEDEALRQRGSKVGRRILTAAMALVLLNVLIGLGVIASKRSKPAQTNAREAQIRQQLAASLGAAAQDALPPPTFAAAEIALNAPRAEWDSIAARVLAAAEQCGGSAAKGLPDDALLTVVADVPTNREAEFRRLVQNPSLSPAPASPPTSGVPNERTIIQVHITEATP